MENSSKTFTLLTELEQIDVHEDQILEELLRRGAELEESERRGRMVTVAELHALRAGLESLEEAINGLQAGVVRAEVAAAERSAAKPANGNGSPKAYGTPAPPSSPAPAVAAQPPAPPPPSPPPTPPTPTFEELATCIRENDAEGGRLRELLRERFSKLETASPSASTGAHGAVGAPGAVGAVGAGGAVVARTFSLTSPPVKGDDVAAFQVALNHRFERWEIALHVKADGTYGPATRQAAQRVARGLGIAPEQLEHGITPAVRGLIRNPSRRTAQQLALARSNGAWLNALRKRYPVHAHAPQARVGGHPNGRASGHTNRSAPAASTLTPTSAAHGSLEAAIRAHGGHYEDIIVREAKAHGVPVSLVCAVIEMESGFANVFGHDAVANPIKGGPVTEERYRVYLQHRRAGRGAQGVGPAQLTWPGFQDRADKLGGCWKPAVNIKVGVEVLAANIKSGGTHGGVAKYNGAGADAQRYADKVLSLERTWRQRLAGASAGASPTGSGSGGGGSHGTAPRGPHAPRVYKLTPQPMSGTDIKAFQDLLNNRMQRWDIDMRIEEDGVYGPATRTLARRVLRGLGIAPAAYAHGITPELRRLIRNPSLRSPQQRALAATNRPWLQSLRKHYAVGGGGASAGANYPLSVRGKLIGTPYSGTHTLGNWQSDNAVDLGVPIGTNMLALDDGKVVKVRHHPQGAGRFAGDQITIQGDRGNAYFYAHGVAHVKAGDRVHRGQVLGTTGSANGVAHLHFGVMKGDPRQLIGQQH